MRKVINLLKNKTAGAYIYIGVVFMIVGFIGALVCVHFFEMYVTHTRTQIVCDTIADGAAVAGQTKLGFREDYAEDAAQRLFDNNKTANTIQNYTMVISNEQENGVETGNKIIEVTMNTTRNSAFDFGLLKNAYSTTGKSVVKVIVTLEYASILSNTFYGINFATSTVPFATTSPGHRNASYVSWLIECYLLPDENPLYLSPNTLPVQHFFFYDYLKTMGMSNVPVKLSNDIANDLNNGTSPFPGWTQCSSAAQIQAQANSGNPAIIFRKTDKANGTSTIDYFVVVPQRGEIANDCVAIAYANRYTNGNGKEDGSSSNYKVITWDDLSEDGTLFAFSHP